jgi:hypothetical protein
VPRALKAQPVRAVILPAAVGALGNNDELHVDPLLCGLTIAWVPGDHGITLLLGGFTQGGKQQEPALTIFITSRSVQRLLKIGWELDLFGSAVRQLGRWWSTTSEEEQKEFAEAGNVVSEEIANLAPFQAKVVAYDPTENPGRDFGLFAGHAHCIVLDKGAPLPAVKGPMVRMHGGPNPAQPPKVFRPESIDGRLRTFEIDQGSLRPGDDRRFLIELLVPQRIRVFLTRAEVDDLMIVLRYQPPWLV